MTRIFAVASISILAAAVIALRRRTRLTPEEVAMLADDSDIVGMPTTWVDGPENSWTLGPGWWVEFAPSSRN